MMDNRKTKSVSGLIRSRLVETGKDFPQKIKQRLIVESDKMANPYKFIFGLFNEGVLGDGSSDSEELAGQQLMVRLAIMIACSKGTDAIDGLMKALEGSGNMELLSDLRTWVKQDLSIDFRGDLVSEPKGTEEDSSLHFRRSVTLAKPKETLNELSPSGPKMVDKGKDNSSVLTQASEKLWKETASTDKGSSSGPKLIDKIMSHLEDEWIERLEGHLIREASKILNFPIFRSCLVHQKVLDEDSSGQLKTGLELEGRQWQSRVKAIKAACSKRTIGSLVAALQQSGNERILEETYQWLETAPSVKKDCLVFVKSLAHQPTKEEPEIVRSNCIQQAASMNDPQMNVAPTWDFQPQVYTRVKFFKPKWLQPSNPKFGLAFGQDRIIGYFADGTVKVWNRRDSENKTIKIDVAKEEIAWFQYDGDTFVLGNAEGTVLLLDATTLQTKWSVSFSDPVDSLDLEESIIVVLKPGADDSKFLWAEISRTNMQLP